MVQPSDASRPHVVVLGGGFAGVYAARCLEKTLRPEQARITLVNRDNYFVFQPLLPEIISGNIGILDAVNPIRAMLRRTEVIVREVDRVDLQRRQVVLSPGFRPRPLTLPFDHLLVALGSVTDFRGMPGLQEHALPFKNVADAIHLRNHVLRVLEEASIEEDEKLRRELLTFVIAGGGFSGVEVAAELNDFVRRAVRRHYPLREDELSVQLVHSGDRVLNREVEEGLSRYATDVLQRRGVELLLGRRLKTASPAAAVLDDDRRIPTRTLVSTVPSSPNPIVDLLDLPKRGGRIEVDSHLAVRGQDRPRIWALGDCALAPVAGSQEFAPPTAQHAVRQAEVAAANIAAELIGRPRRDFRFQGLGKMGALGHHCAVAELPGGLRISGFPAWLLWRGVYWWKLPGLFRKVRVAMSWLLSVVFPPDLAQLKIRTSNGVSQAHYQAGEFVFRQGDVGDAMYVVTRGQVEVVKECDGRVEVIATLGEGEVFGEMALMRQAPRNASVRCASDVDVLIVRERDAALLVGNLPEFQKDMNSIIETRTQEHEASGPQ